MVNAKARAPGMTKTKRNATTEKGKKFSHLLPLFLLSHDVDGNVVLFLLFRLIRRLPGLVLPPAVLVVAVLAPSGAAALLILVEIAAAFEVVVVVVRVSPAPLSSSSSVAAGVVAAAAVAGVVPAVAATIYAK